MNRELFVRCEPRTPITRLDLRWIAAVFSFGPDVRLEHHAHRCGVCARGAERHREIGLAEGMRVVASQLRRREAALAGERNECDRVVAEFAKSRDLDSRAVRD